MSDNKIWRCNVCNNIHHSVSAPEICPTCKANNAYVEIEKQEAANIMGFKNCENKPDKNGIIAAWKNFTEHNDFILNPDTAHINIILDGVIKNEEKFGLKLCPCRLRDGSRERDLELICPCNFKIQNIWKEKDMCWCGLFVRE
ncbi:hypothetical protein HQ545_07245 [Candidatus Woesearchaeota archaeon]|nr:hypothetical protein [Candidatus Woesearchaeota archaeon]